MKKFFFLMLGLMMINFSYAQNKEGKDNKAYTEAMKGLLTKMSAAKSTDALTSVKNGFTRVASIDSTEWLPYYYAAYAGLLQSYEMKGDAIDKALDEVDGYLIRATSVAKKLDEILILQSWAASARISVNPMTRGAKYGMQSAGLLNRAESVNPVNPRIFFLKGQNAFYTPEQFGGGKKIAKTNLLKAQELFKVFKLENDLMPNWGKDETDQRLKEIDTIGQETDGMKK